MASDALLTLAPAGTTKTATFSGSAVDTGVVQANQPVTGAPFAPLGARVLYSAASNASGANTAVFTIDGSQDGSNWLTLAGARFTDSVTLSTTPQAGEIFIPFVQRTRYLRLTLTITGAGVSPTITYGAEITPAAGPA